MPPKNNSRRMDELLASVTEDLLSGDPQQFEDNSIRIERILLEMVRPDPVQPRRVLPEQLHRQFHSNRLTPTQALKELVQLVQLAARQRGRPFNNVLELLPNPDDERNDEPDTKLSPEEQLLYDLVNLAITIRDDGQVNPLTVVDVSEGVTRQFRIETGERRYWATWLLRDFISGYSGDGMIPCIIIPVNSASAFRQAKENTARSGLSAIAMARQAALLLLLVHGYDIPDGPVTSDYYRQALDLTLRDKREYTAEILAALGGITRFQFSRYKSLLSLSDEAMELADRHQLDESRLRYVISLEPDDHEELVRQIIQLGLTRAQVKELVEKGDVKAKPEQEGVSRQVVQLAKLMRASEMPDAQHLVQALVAQERDTNIARVRIQNMRRLLEEAEAYLE